MAVIYGIGIAASSAGEILIIVALIALLQES